jgi:hypothetical protein
MADTALILGLAGIGGTVAASIASPWIAAHLATEQQESAFEHERTMRDTEQLRILLDEIAVEMHETGSALGTLTTALKHLGQGIGERENWRQTLFTAGEHGRNLRVLVERLAVRIGVDSPAYRAADAGGNASSIGLGAVAAAMAESDGGLGDVLDADPTEELDKLQAARRSFTKAAHELVGVPIPVTPAGATPSPTPLGGQGRGDTASGATQ